MDTTEADGDRRDDALSAEREIDRLRRVLSALRWWSVLPFFGGLVVAPAAIGVAVVDQTAGSRGVLGMTIALGAGIAGVGAMKLHDARRTLGATSRPIVILMSALTASTLCALALIPHLGAPLHGAGFLALGGAILTATIAFAAATECCTFERQHQTESPARLPEPVTVLALLVALAGGALLLAGAMQPPTRGAVELARGGLSVLVVTAVAIGIHAAIEAVLVLIASDRVIHAHDRHVLPEPPRLESELEWVVPRCVHCGYQRDLGASTPACSECGTPWQVDAIDVQDQRRLKRLRAGAMWGVVFVVGTPVLAVFAPCFLLLFVPAAGLASTALVGASAAPERARSGALAIGAPIACGLALPYALAMGVSELAILGIGACAATAATAVSAWILVCWGERETMRHGDPLPPWWLWVIIGAAFLLPLAALVIEFPATIGAGRLGGSMIGSRIALFAGYAVVGFIVCRLGILLARDIGRHLRSRPITVSGPRPAPHPPRPSS